MKSRITALVASFALGGSLLFISAGVATAAGPATTGPAGKGVCATEAAASREQHHRRRTARLWRLRDQPPLRDAHQPHDQGSLPPRS
jgi:hypothetical protein